MGAQLRSSRVHHPLPSTVCVAIELFAYLLQGLFKRSSLKLTLNFL